MSKKILIAVFGIAIFLVGISWGFYLQPKDILSSDYKFTIIADNSGGVKGTGSMEPAIHKGDKLFYRIVGENEILWEERVYVYRTNESDTTIHRLISKYIGEDGKEYFIFKGDANVRADKPILREQVEWELIGQCFEGAKGLCT